MTLSPELARFAADAVAAGRYRDVAEVVAAGVSLLQRQEAARAELLASVLAAEQEAEREGCVTGDEMLARAGEACGEVRRLRVRPPNLSPQALRDIDEAVDEIAASAAGPAFADRFAVAVSDVAQRVAHRPLLGHRRLELLPPRFRFSAVKGFDYLLVYNAEHPDRLVLSGRAYGAGPRPLAGRLARPAADAKRLSRRAAGRRPR